MQTTILIVDDETDMLDLIAYNLRKFNHQVQTACTGKDGIHRAQLVLPDLIILDLKLPDLDGFAACEILRRLPSTHAIPILMLSAMSGQKARIRGFRSGTDAFMRKPFKLQTLIDQVERMLVMQAVINELSSPP